MDINFSTLFAGFAFGTFGIYLIREGKRLSNPWHFSIGLILLIFPYFVIDTLLTWTIGTLLLGLAWAKR